MKFQSLFTLTIVVALSGCFFESVRPVDRNLKPYGAHWIKDGMTREGRLNDYTNCGGSKDLKEGYEIEANQSVADFFKMFNAHVVQVASCMRGKGYTYLE